MLELATWEYQVSEHGTWAIWTLQNSKLNLATEFNRKMSMWTLQFAKWTWKQVK
jgi:hypothetical protein